MVRSLKRLSAENKNAGGKTARAVLVPSSIRKRSAELPPGAAPAPIATDRPTSTRWQQLPLPKSHWPGISQIAIERGGILWALANNEIYYWTEQEMATPRGDKLRSGMYLGQLFGGQDRDLYLSQPGTEEHQGKLYRLCDGAAEYVTDFYYEVSHEYPGLYVSPSGRLINWGKRFVAVYVDGKWKQHAAELGVRGFRAFEIGRNVVICSQQKFYVVDENANVHTHDLVFGDLIPLKYTPQICAWGENRILVKCRDLNRLFAFDVNTGKSVDVDAVNQQLSGRRVIDFFARPDGTVWLRTSRQRGQDVSFIELTPQGRAAPVDSKIDFGRSPVRYRQYPKGVLHARSGATWVALEDGSITRIQNGELRRFGWKDGLSAGKCRYLLEDLKGIVYAASHKGIAAWRPAGEAGPLPKWVGAWQEFRLRSYQPIRDSNGNVWMLRADQPGKISRWDGRQWHHQQFTGGPIYRGMADDQGHLLLAGSTTCFDISTDGIVRFPNVKLALIAAQSRGVRRLDTDRNYQGCLFLDDGRIWFGIHNNNDVHYFDGNRWDSFTLRDDIYYLYKSAEHEVLIRSQGGKFYKYNQGKLELVTELRGQSSLLWGSKLFQPFELALAVKHSEDFVIVNKRQIRIPFQETNGQGKLQVVFETGDKVPQHTSTLTRAWSYGHWTDYQAAPIFRIWGHRVVQCDWQETPLLSRWYEIRQVIEDRAGNLWTWVAGYSSQQVFMKRMSDFRVTATVDDDGKITVKPAAAWHGNYVPRIFWRTNGISWQGGEPAESIVVQSTKATSIEIVAMDRQGGTIEPLRVQLPADKSLK